MDEEKDKYGEGRGVLNMDMEKNGRNKWIEMVRNEEVLRSLRE